MSGKIQVIVGGQFGSEGKGAIAGYLARKDELSDGLAVRVGGSQAGHTVYGACPLANAGWRDESTGLISGPSPATCDKCGPWGHPWPLRHVPVAAVVNPHANLAIAAGSEIDIRVLASEVERLELAGIKVRHRLTIDPMATVIDQAAEGAEKALKLTDRIGSTGKGVGAARAARVMRTARLVRDVALEEDLNSLGEVGDIFSAARDVLRLGGTVQIEGVQGYGLGLHTEHYPYTTSADCRAVDFLAMLGISPWADYVRRVEVFVVVRPNPIRVAGNSGLLRGETTWDALGLKPELTTVTQKLRRVGEWDPDLVRVAIEANGGASSGFGKVWLAVTMIDHLEPSFLGLTDWPDEDMHPHNAAFAFLDQINRELGTDVALVGTGPATVADFR